MHPFITFREPLPSGEMGYFILQRAWPHYVGRIVTQYEHSPFESAPVPHHDLYMAFSGTLNGNLIPAREGIQWEVANTLSAMALWFYEERISPNPKKYAKWHFDSTQLSS